MSQHQALPDPGTKLLQSEPMRSAETTTHTSTSKNTVSMHALPCLTSIMDSPLALYQGLPYAHATLTFFGGDATTTNLSSSIKEGEPQVVSDGGGGGKTFYANVVAYSVHSYCGCHCTQKEFSLSEYEVESVSQEPIQCWLLLRDAILSFLFAMFFHFVPAVLYGPEKSLGSSSTHAKWGILWFGGWLIWWAIATGLLRSWGLRIQPGGAFLRLSTFELAVRSANIWKNVKNKSSPKTEKENGSLMERLPEKSSEIVGDQEREGGKEVDADEDMKSVPAIRASTVFGMALVLFLIAWGIYTAVLLNQCMGMGCCRDDESTLANCTQKWNAR